MTAGGAASAGRNRASVARGPEILLLCALAWSAGLIHIQAALDHFDEYVPYAICFIVLAVMQLGWGALTYRRPSRGALWAGAVGSLAVAVAWGLSRTTGLPLGPDARAPESVGLLDMIATLDELALLALALPRLWPGVACRVAGVRAALCTAGLLMVFGSSLVLGGGFHAH